MPEDSIHDVTGNGTGTVSFKAGAEACEEPGGLEALASGNEFDIETTLSATTFRPNDGFTGETSVTFSIVGTGVDESVEIAMAVAPNNSIVNTADDVVDAGDGLLSLREAVELVNQGVTLDTITFDLSVFNGEAQDIIRLTDGRIFITDTVSIDGDLDGDGTPDVTISGDALGDDITDANGITNVSESLAGTDRLDDNSRIFVSPNHGLTLNGLTLTGGRTTLDGSGVNDTYFGGGAISTPYAAVYISNSILSGNSTAGYVAGGGAISAYAGITLHNMVVSNNSTSGDYAIGGGLMSKWGNVRLYNGQVSNNTTTGLNADGGGAATYGANIYAIESTISGRKTTSAGGGLSADGYVTLVSLTVNSNSAGGYGGGVEASSNINLVNAIIISGNSATTSTGYGGGISTFGGLFLTDFIILGNGRNS